MLGNCLAPLALTMGEPAGIGPDITALAWLALKERVDRHFFVIGDRSYLESRIGHLRLDVPVAAVGSPSEAAAVWGSSRALGASAFTSPQDNVPFRYPSIQINSSRVDPRTRSKKAFSLVSGNMVVNNFLVIGQVLDRIR